MLDRREQEPRGIANRYRTREPLVHTLQATYQRARAQVHRKG